MSYYYDPYDDELRTAERDDAQVELDLVRAERQRLEAQLESLKSTQDPEAATLAQLAAGAGKSVEEVRAIVAEVRAASSVPKAPDFAKLDKALESVDPHDYEGAVRALDAAGYVTQDVLGQSWQHGRIQRAGERAARKRSMRTWMPRPRSRIIKRGYAPLD
jgi:septal ring factor EnvC (AmiA/AmiB activator)